MKRRTIKKCAMSLLAGGGAAMGATHEWTGGGTHAWNDADDWDCGAFCGAAGYPTLSTDDAIIETNNVSIDVPGDETIDSISIANGGSSGHGPTFVGVGGTTVTTITGSSLIISGANSGRTVVKAMDLAQLKTN